MTQARLEHINISVSDPDSNAQILCTLFDWKIRWAGPSMDNGYTVHVGTDDQYIAFYTSPNLKQGEPDSEKLHKLNHIAVEVEDLKQAEQTVVQADLTPFSHADYEPGRRFYFLLNDNLEVEVVSYN